MRLCTTLLYLPDLFPWPCTFAFAHVSDTSCEEYKKCRTRSTRSSRCKPACRPTANGLRLVLLALSCNRFKCSTDVRAKKPPWRSPYSGTRTGPRRLPSPCNCCTTFVTDAIEASHLIFIKKAKNDCFSENFLRRRNRFNKK